MRIGSRGHFLAYSNSRHRPCLLHILKFTLTTELLMNDFRSLKQPETDLGV